MTSSTPTEAETRKRYIDKALERAGWNVEDAQRVGREIPVDGFDPLAWQALRAQIQVIGERGVSYETALPAGISDYVLFRDNGEVLAVVETKRTSVDPRAAQAQTEFYVSEIARQQSFQRFAFMTNGHEIYFLDKGHANKRLVSGFFTETDLLGMLHTQQHGEPLSTVSVNTAITDSDYQIEDIRRVTEAFDSGKRKALLVMATVTGKTRTVMSLIDVFLRVKRAQRILDASSFERRLRLARFSSCLLEYTGSIFSDSHHGQACYQSGEHQSARCEIHSGTFGRHQ